MLQKRVIPFLTLEGTKLVKTRRFKNPVYIGDPINAVRIFNEKEVDELVLLDITRSKRSQGPNFELIEKIASEAFIPLAYGGRVSKLEDFRKLFYLGVEKVVVNTALHINPELVRLAAKDFGSQSVVASIDVYKPMWRGYQVVVAGGSKKLKANLSDYLNKVQDLGCGEIVVGAVHCDGMMEGYDQRLVEYVKEYVHVPLVVVGGAGKLSDIKALAGLRVDGFGMGSRFVFQGKHRGVMINYPNREKIMEVLDGV